MGRVASMSFVRSSHVLFGKHRKQVASFRDQHSADSNLDRPYFVSSPACSELTKLDVHTADLMSAK